MISCVDFELSNKVGWLMYELRAGDMPHMSIDDLYFTVRCSCFLAKT